MVAGCLSTAALAAYVGRPAAYLEADPGLAHLLRGMALIKALMVSGAVALVWWRLRLPIAGRVAWREHRPE